MNSPAKNALRLKMAGLIFTFVGVVAFTAIGEMGDFEKPVAAAPRNYVFIAGAWLIAAQLVAIGLIVLLAGLKDVPLLTSARARRGALQKLAGSAGIMLCFAIVGLEDLPVLKPLLELWWVELTGMALFLITAHVGFRLLRSGWKYDVVSAEQLLANDPRLPVVYLRSFEADSEIVLRRDGLWNKAVNILFGYWVTFSPEQELAEIVTRVGPVIAIGKPGEPLPELGAARLYVGDADWKAKVIDLMARSRLVIIRTGSTPNLEWEIEQAMTRVPRRQILFVSLGDEKKTAVFDQYFERRFGQVLPSGTTAVTPLWLKQMSMGKVSGNYATGKIIYFDEALKPREEPIRLSVSWVGLAVGMMRPHRDPLQTAMKHVFVSLELPWVTRNSQTMAVLLAMFGGAFGLHHFYLGDRRRGFKYLALFFISMFKGWYDAVKLAQLTSHEFDRKYPPRQVIPLSSSASSASSAS